MRTLLSFMFILTFKIFFWIEILSKNPQPEVIVISILGFFIAASLFVYNVAMGSHNG